MKQVLLIFNIFLVLIGNAQNKIEFVSEDITFEILEDEFYINGTYFFKNLNDTCTETIIDYPFPQDEYMGNVNNFDIYTDTNKTKYSIIDISDKRAIFASENCDNRLYFFNIKYQQKILKDSVKYILTTTKSWNKSLQNADYKLIVPENLEITFFSYYPDDELEAEKKKIYFWHMDNFYPDEDFIIKYKKTD
jgi:hypothetical protein